MADFGQNLLKNCHAGFSEKPADLSVFPVFTVPPSSPVRFGRIFLIFIDFYRFFQKPTGLMKSDFRSSTEFLNTAPVWLRMSSYLAFKCV
jgi:hypothetical protein